MATQVNNLLANAIKTRMLSSGAVTPPVTLYFALYTTAPDVSIGSLGTEVSGGSYARVAKTCNLTNFSGTQGKNTTAISSGTTGIIYNNNDIVFPTPTANWGTVTTVVVLDHITNVANANIWYVSPMLPVPLFVSSGVPFSLLSGQWSLSLT